MLVAILWAMSPRTDEPYGDHEPFWKVLLLIASPYLLALSVLLTCLAWSRL